MPEAAKPMEVLSLVHAKVVPLTGLEKLIVDTEAPLQTVSLLAITLTVGVGFTVMLITEVGLPMQPLAKGVTDI